MLFNFLFVTEDPSSRIVYPYPETKHCLLPPEDKTGKPICRHLPVELMPPLPKGHNSPGAVLTALSRPSHVYVSV